MTVIKKQNRNTEAFLYAALWILVVGVYLLSAMRHRAQLSEPLLDVGVFNHLTRTILPIFILFCINNWLLIPRILLCNKWKTYIFVTFLLLIALGSWQYYSFIDSERCRPPHPFPPHEYRPLVPMPVLLDFTYGLLAIGINLAITLMFQRYDDKLERESMQKINAEHQLAYLKSQINPHFYLNMLNNIHGMIDIDKDKAQKMLIDMSKLMRFMLYDSTKSEIHLNQEIEFLDNYLKLMRQRYPSDRVAITWNFPSRESIDHITLPPLLFLSFIENAFKHGISYRSCSYIAVNMEINVHSLKFSCMNSIPESVHHLRKENYGIGLKNIMERLSLIYGNQADLNITQETEKYIVSLTIPIDNNASTYN